MMYREGARVHCNHKIDDSVGSRAVGLKRREEEETSRGAPGEEQESHLIIHKSRHLTLNKRG